MPSEMDIHTNPQGVDPALMETRLVRLEWPEAMRIGEEYSITLDFEQLQDNNLPENPIVGFSDVYDCCNVMAEARFEVSGIKVDPASATRESMPPGQPVSFKWKISAEQAGSYSGTIWLSLRFLPLDGGTPIQGPVYVNNLLIDARSILGLSGGMARLLGWVGVILGIFLISDVWIDLARRRNNREIIATENAESIRNEPKDL